VGRSRRDDILERAAHLMKIKGFAGMSARDIAEELEFSKANFFYHVKSKEELLYQIFVENLEYAFRHVEEILKRSDPAPVRLRAIVDFYVHLNCERSAVMLVWFKEKGHLTPEHEAHVTRLEQKIVTMLHDFYGSAIEAGELRTLDPTIVRIAVFGMCFALTRWPQLREQHSLQSLSAQIQDIACNGLLPT
jgi:AcrR family transcriptional regulator